MSDEPKACVFWADTLERIRSFPRDVRIDFGHALTLVEQGGVPARFDHLSELGSGVMEIKSNHDRETYRAFYVAKFPEAVYVLDAIHKKSKRGKALPRADKERVRRRYRDVLAHRTDMGHA